MKIQIKNRWTGSILFEYEKENNTILDTIQEAVKQGVNLGFADLQGADLRGSNLKNVLLQGADLSGADLSDANLRGADLSFSDIRGAILNGADISRADLYMSDIRGANLRCSDIRCANLSCADIRYANIRGADIRYANLSGAHFEDACLEDWGILQDMLIIGCIGSRNDYTIAYKTDKGIFVQCGCFEGTIEEFKVKVKETHLGTDHEMNYLAMVEFIKIKFQ